MRDGYAPGYGDDARAMLLRRGAAERAAFLLARLQPGARVLDAGCGPGSITLGLARAVGTSGGVVGVDVEPAEIARACALAAVESVANVHFEAASCYALPFPGSSFDAALAHALLEHLTRPADALAELRRVLRPDGLLGVVSSDWSRAVVEPAGADVERALAGHHRLRLLAGGDPFAGRDLPELVEAAGFTVLAVEEHDRVDLSHAELGRYVRRRLEDAVSAGIADTGLAAAAEAAARWPQVDGGRSTQRWVSVLTGS